MIRLIAALFPLLFLMGLALANGNHDAKLEFPSWTYWVEIIEHTAIFLTGLVAIFYLLALRKKMEKGINTANVMLFGLALLVIGELLTNLHHFLVYPFGELNAIVNHGLLLVSIIVIVYAYISLQMKALENFNRKS